MNEDIFALVLETVLSEIDVGHGRILPVVLKPVARLHYYDLAVTSRLWTFASDKDVRKQDRAEHEVRGPGIDIQ